MKKSNGLGLVIGTLVIYFDMYHCLSYHSIGNPAKNLRKLLAQGSIGLGSRSMSHECSVLMQEIIDLKADPAQRASGIVAGVILKNDCQILLETDVLSWKTQEEQDKICSNSCYSQLETKYSKLLELDCFKGVDEIEKAAGRLQAASYRFACQRTMEDLYCIPLMGEENSKLENNDYDICGDIVATWDCCFQNYKLYYDHFGMNSTKVEIQKINAQCGSEDIGQTMCPCANNPYPGPLDSKLRTCKGSSLYFSRLVVLGFTGLVLAYLI